MTARGGVCFSYMEKFATNLLVKILLGFMKYHQSVKQLRSKQIRSKLFANVISRNDTSKSKKIMSKISGPFEKKNQHI